MVTEVRGAAAEAFICLNYISVATTLQVAPLNLAVPGFLLLSYVIPRLDMHSFQHICPIDLKQTKLLLLYIYSLHNGCRKLAWYALLTESMQTRRPLHYDLLCLLSSFSGLCGFFLTAEWKCDRQQSKQVEAAADRIAFCLTSFYVRRQVASIRLHRHGELRGVRCVRFMCSALVCA